MDASDTQIEDIASLTVGDVEGIDEKDEFAPMTQEERAAHEAEASKPDEAQVEKAQDRRKEDFFGIFQMAFALPGNVKSCLQPVAIQKEEMQVAREASDFTYEQLEEWFPNFNDMEMGKLARGVISVAFIGSKVTLARQCLQMEKQLQAEDEQKAEAENLQVKPETDQSVPDVPLGVLPEGGITVGQ